MLFLHFFFAWVFRDFGFVFFLYFVFLRFWIRIFFVFFSYFFGKNTKKIQNKYKKNTKKIHLVLLYFFCIFLLRPKIHFVFLYFFCFFSFFFRLLFVFLYFGHFVKKQHRKSTNVCCISFVLMILSLLWLYFFCNLGLYLFCIFFVFLMFSGFTVCCRHPTTQPVLTMP